jgi:23S rRNA pseudouridine1911/1915/1917 synthase
VKQFETTALLEIDLDTGRTHQIRAQLADAGHPLLGDWLYGTKDDRNLAPRVLLHAWKLELTDPELGFRVESPIPAELS